MKIIMKKLPEFHRSVAFTATILLACFFCFSGLIPFSALASGALKDSESASHSDTAAIHDPIATYEFSGFKVVQFNLAVLSHYSYMIFSNGKSMVVDPGRDIETYLEWAAREKSPVAGVMLTHSHADFVAGHMEFASADCPVFQNSTSGAEYPFKGLVDGQVLPFQGTSIKILATPGHTPDGMSFLISSASAPLKPLICLTGDALFVGSIGRPDLMGGSMSAASLASMSFDTWNSKFSPLDDSVIVLPAHGAGSLCGAHLRDEPSTTIGRERETNPYLIHTNRNDFIMSVLEGLPEAPQYFKHNAAMNRMGPEKIQKVKKTPKIGANDLERILKKSILIDLRNPELFAGGHIPESINIGIRGRFETWTGIMIPWGTEPILIGESLETSEAVFRLNRIGYRSSGTITFDEWKTAGKKIMSNQRIRPVELHKMITQGTGPIIVDVRLPNEWMGLRIGNIINMPLNKLSLLCSNLDPLQQVVTVCNSAYRSSMGIGILEKAGFVNVSSLDGGSEAWINAGLPVLKPQGSNSGATALPLRILELPDRMEPQELKRLILDMPDSFEIMDIRPSVSFSEYHLPGSRNIHIADLLENQELLVGSVPLVIVDRDGTLSMMAAALISRKTKRPVKALFGGLEAYWTNSPDLSPDSTGPNFTGVGAVTRPESKNPVPKNPASPSQSTPKEIQPVKKVKKSAGC